MTSTHTTDRTGNAPAFVSPVLVSNRVAPRISREDYRDNKTWCAALERAVTDYGKNVDADYFATDEYFWEAVCSGYGWDYLPTDIRVELVHLVEKLANEQGKSSYMEKIKIVDDMSGVTLALLAKFN